jgi:histidine ammonia-lyase
MPASAETANTGAGKEDHVSMGGFSARKAVQVSTVYICPHHAEEYFQRR